MAARRHCEGCSGPASVPMAAHEGRLPRPPPWGPRKPFCGLRVLLSLRWVIIRGGVRSCSEGDAHSGPSCQEQQRLSPGALGAGTHPCGMHLGPALLPVPSCAPTAGLPLLSPRARFCWFVCFSDSFTHPSILALTYLLGLGKAGPRICKSEISSV